MGKLTHQCPECDKEISFSNLSKHMREPHSNEKTMAKDSKVIRRKKRNYKRKPSLKVFVEHENLMTVERNPSLIVTFVDSAQEILNLKKTFKVMRNTKSSNNIK